ncbi:MAG: hypothetical protein K6B74_11290 [Ruminococcus sp.]|nr:hypothetical protein [Ruminococcus sp.]
MREKIYLISFILVSLTAISIVLYSVLNIVVAYSFAITFGTTAYHFIMRLAVGGVIDALMKNHADYTKKWYRLRDWEKNLYKHLNVKKWKGRLPTFQPDYFDPKKHSWDEIAQAMCQAETVHEIIIVLSFIPIVFSHWFGALPVFIVTSLLAALIDLCFVIIQRYNRPRVIKLIKNTDMQSNPEK